MSEHQPMSPEVHGSAETNIERPEHQEQSRKHEKEPESNKAELEQTIEKLRSTVKHEAISGKDVSVEKSKKGPSEGSSTFVNYELKQLMFKRTLTHIQKQLSAPARTFSKLTHAKIVDTVSSGAERTVARPKGFLVGSIAAFLGSAYTLYTAKHYGFSYNALLFFILFIAGYAVTTVVELIASKTRRHTS